MDISNQCRPRLDAAEHGVWSGSTLFVLSSEISTKHDNDKNQPDTSYIGIGPVQSLFVCVEVLRPSQPNGVMLSAVSLPNHTFTGQA